MGLKKFVKTVLHFMPIASLFFYAGIMNAQGNKMPEKLLLVDSGFIFSNAPFQSCHASSLVALPANKIMAAWFGGKHESNPDVTIWSSVNEKGIWSDPKEIALAFRTMDFAMHAGILFYLKVEVVCYFFIIKLEDHQENGGQK